MIQAAQLLGRTPGSLGRKMFRNCERLVHVGFPFCVGNKSTVDNLAFSGCNALTEIYLPEGLVSLGWQALHAEKLETLYLPATIGALDGDVFWSSVRTLVFSGDAPTTGSQGRLDGTACTVYVPAATGGWDDTWQGCKVVRLPSSLAYERLADRTAAITGGHCSGNGVLFVPDRIDGLVVTEIKGGAFSNQTDITSVCLPSSLRKIGPRAFFRCSSLANVTIQSTGTLAIGKEAFAYCISLEKVVFPSSVANGSSIGEGAFGWCAALTGTFTLSTGFASIGKDAFLMSGLKGFDLPATIRHLGSNSLTVAADPPKIIITFWGHAPEVDGSIALSSDSSIWVPSNAKNWGETWQGCEVKKDSRTVPEDE